MLGSLSPVVHYSNPSLYRVPLKRDNDHFTIYVGDNFVRNFTHDKLPDEVKTKLTMISAASKSDVRDWDICTTDLYVPKYPIEGFKEIGWQTSDSYFCVCISVELLDELRGKVDS